MSEYILLLLLIKFTGLVFGYALCAWVYEKRRKKLDKFNKSLLIEIATLKERVAGHSNQEELARILTAKIWESQESKFLRKNEISLENILKPMQQTLKTYRSDMNNQVESFKNSHIQFGEKFSMFQEIVSSMHQDAKNLTNALTSKSQARGAWGESVLVEILQKWGLRENENYRLQDPQKSEDGGKKIPDVIIDLPDNRHLVIDSKVTLNAWVEYESIENKQLKQEALKKHIAAVRARVSELAGKKYQEELNSPDMVLMFVPIEQAFLEAIREDANLLSNAFEKKVFVLGHTNLVLAIHLVQDIWRQHKQNENVYEISNRGRLLYEQFIRFLKDLEHLGDNLKKTVDSFQSAEKRLSTGGSRSLISQAEKLVELGVKSDQKIPKRFKNKHLEEDY
ncbi:MAG: hypothetical protein CMK56_01295 [Proteobacteria bacterium]|nr:hypothetical protein [Pseudomonadota bacterium]|tara:strand:- start:1853 stop:3037 length:1185 start_codon:yes stop_codon:yes gene_type:complete